MRPLQGPIQDRLGDDESLIMRVLHVQRVKGIGGSERHLLALLPALVERGVDVRMCVMQMGDGRRFVEAMRLEGIDVTVQTAGRDVNPATVFELFREIERFRPDVVHTHLVHADLHGLIAARARRVPAVSSVHGTPAFYTKEPYRSLGRLSGRLAARRIAISDHVARFLLDNQLARRDRLSVVHYGIDAGEPPSAETRRTARHGLGLGDHHVVFGIASRLIPGKGHDLLIEAFGRVARRDASVVLIVAGDGPERDNLEQLVDAHCPPGSVRFLGFLDSVGGFMAACDVLAFPTQPELGEGFGLAALEGMAAGRPVVATNVGSLPEVVLSGVTGLIVGPHSATALEHALAELSEDAPLRGRMGAAGSARAREVFPLDAMVTKTLAIYEELI